VVAVGGLTNAIECPTRETDAVGSDSLARAALVLGEREALYPRWHFMSNRAGVNPECLSNLVGGAAALQEHERHELPDVDEFAQNRIPICSH